MKKSLPILAPIPEIVGTIGYVISGERFSNALYAAFALYFTNPVSDAYNIYIEIARWTAPLVMVTAILCVLENVGKSLWNRALFLVKKDTVSIYSDTDDKISFGKGVSVVYPGEKFIGYAKEHIIMFLSDQKNLQFYENHKKKLAGKKTFLTVRDVESSFLNPVEKENVIIFDVNNSIARMLWKKIKLWEKEKNELDIAIWGSSKLAGNIVSTGIQLNLFSLDQKIKYHIITDNKLFREKHKNLKLMNADELLYHNPGDSDVWNVISSADIVIVSDVSDVELVQTIVVQARCSEVYYYSPKEGDIISYFSYNNVNPFGRNKNVLTDDNVRRGGLIKKAEALNEEYAKQHGGKSWNDLSGFEKGSNISAADFGEVLAFLNEREISEEAQAELEHIRWCRYLFLNYYTTGTPENGKNKDEDKRIHKYLVAYDELDKDTKDKDLETIRITRNKT